MKEGAEESEEHEEQEKHEEHEEHEEQEQHEEHEEQGNKNNKETKRNEQKGNMKRNRNTFSEPNKEKYSTGKQSRMSKRISSRFRKQLISSPKAVVDGEL